MSLPPDRPVPRDHPAARDDTQLLAECEQTFTRRSGPGGQNRNKVESAVILHHRPTGLRVEANERRTQGENRREAVRRLRVQLALTVRTPVDPLAPPPSPLWRSRLRAGRIALSAEHPDVPLMIAEALDVWHDRASDPKATAEALGCSTSQLVKLLRMEPAALAAINRDRASQDLHPLT